MSLAVYQRSNYSFLGCDNIKGWIEIVPTYEVVPLEYVRVKRALWKRKKAYIRKRKFELKYKEGI